MAKQPLVSIVIPTFYRNDTLRNCLRSVFDQSYDNLDIIVVDDSGERHAEPVLADYPRGRYIPLDENKGPNAARNEGIRRSTGAYIQLLDDDDVLDQEKIEKQVMALESKPDIGMVYCGWKLTTGRIFRPTDNSGDELSQALSFDLNACITSTMLIDANLVTEIAPLPDLPGSDDTFLKIELAQRTRFAYLDEVLVTKGSNQDNRAASWGAVQGIYYILDEYQNLYDEMPLHVRKRAESRAAIKEGTYYINNYGWSFQATKKFIEATLKRPGVSATNILLILISLFGRPGYRFVRRMYHIFCQLRKVKNRFG